ncbi:MAG: 3-phosphoshikimate 1-carboxyvinyltransferase [Acutalibacteraceae bacterium]
MRVKIKKGAAFGAVDIPSSKSYAHRLMICAGLSQGESRIGGLDRNQDVLATADCLTALGASVRFEDRNAFIRGCGKNIIPGQRLECRESGSTLRFLIPVALLGGGGDFVGAGRLMERGVGVYEKLFSGRGIEISPIKNGISAKGRLKSGEYIIPGDVSSQFISGMLFALPLADGDSKIEVTQPFESRSYVDMTVDALRQSGIDISAHGGRFFEIKGSQEYRPLNTKVEGDWSNAAFFYALNVIGGNVKVNGLRNDSCQGDRICLEYLRRLSLGKATINISDCPDLAPILFTVAAACHGGVFEGTRRLAIKESDRAAVMAQELAKCGAEVKVCEDTAEVIASDLHEPTEPFCGHNDHRVIMSLSVMSTLVGGVIEGAQAVSKSYPGFFDALSRLGVEVEIYD